jgi:hypothetical protein
MIHVPVRKLLVYERLTMADDTYNYGWWGFMNQQTSLGGGPHCICWTFRFMGDTTTVKLRGLRNACIPRSSDEQTFLYCTFGLIERTSQSEHFVDSVLCRHLVPTPFGSKWLCFDLVLENKGAYFRFGGHLLEIHSNSNENQGETSGANKRNRAQNNKVLFLIATSGVSSSTFWTWASFGTLI